MSATILQQLRQALRQQHPITIYVDCNSYPFEGALVRRLTTKQVGFVVPAQDSGNGDSVLMEYTFALSTVVAVGVVVARAKPASSGNSDYEDDDIWL